MKNKNNIKLKKERRGEMGELLKWIIWGIVFLIAIIAIGLFLKKLGVA